MICNRNILKEYLDTKSTNVIKEIKFFVVQVDYIFVSYLFINESSEILTYRHVSTSDLMTFIKKRRNKLINQLI